MARDRIEIDTLELACVVGIRPEEREREQPLVVDVALELDLARAGRSGRIADTCDYAELTTELVALVRFRRYKLLENAAEELAAMVLGVHEGIDRVELRLAKPCALPGARQAAIRVSRSVVDYPRRREAARFGEVEVLLETREAGLYLLHVDPGHAIPLHHHQRMRELEWLVRGELVRDGRPLAPVEPHEWSIGAAHGYQNPSTERASLFCCDIPPFIPADEIDLASEPGV
jgi:FolB domain-containing protein